jgi:hypothetical protein
VRIHGNKDWVAIAELVPGRTKKQCYNRWHNVFDPSIALTAGSTGKWTTVEDSKLKDAAQTHGGKNWAAIASLVPGRAEKQCCARWHDTLNPSIAQTAGREGKWSKGEDIKLKDAVQTHGGKNWGAISALVPGRTKAQCRHRWYDILAAGIDQSNRRTDKRAEDEQNPGLQMPGPGMYQRQIYPGMLNSSNGMNCQNGFLVRVSSFCFSLVDDYIELVLNSPSRLIVYGRT